MGGALLNWLEIAVSADEEAVESVAEVLRTFGRGVAIHQPFVQPRSDEPPQHDPSGRPVLDMGTGSGILAIAAARLGAAEVVGIDVDPVAVSAARSNVKLNRLENIVQVHEDNPTTGSPDGFGFGEFDLVLANITARTNATLAEYHAASLAPGGRLVASGILADAADMVIAAFTRARLNVLSTEQDGDW